MPLRLQKQQIILVIGVMLALVTIILVQFYIDQQRRADIERSKAEAQKLIKDFQANLSTVLVAKQFIPAGKALEAEMIEGVSILAQQREPKAVSAAARIDGMVAVMDIGPNEQITMDKVTYTGRKRAGLSESTPPGKRAIAISVDSISSVGGMIKPGDYVDVVAMAPSMPLAGADGKKTSQPVVLPLFQNVLVLAVGQETASPSPLILKKEEKSSIPSSITLALGPEEANIISFVQEQGKIRLVLRAPSDSNTQEAGPISWDTVFRYLVPSEKPDVQTVEIYRGLNRETMPLTDSTK